MFQIKKEYSTKVDSYPGSNEVAQIIRGDRLFYVDRKFKKEEVDADYFENEAVQFYKVFFDFAYYTLLTPFHFKYNRNEGTYVCKKNIRQRTLQWILCSFTTLYFLLRLNRMTKLDPEENPSLYFQIAYYFFDTTFLVALFLTFQVYLAKLFHVITELQAQNRRYYREARNAHKTHRLTTIICVGCLGTLLLQVLETFLDADWSFLGFWQYWIDDAVWVYGYTPLTDIFSLPLGVLSLIGSLFEKLLNAFSDILFTMTVLLFNNIVNSFYADMLKKSATVEFHHPVKVLEHYWWLKYITGELNSAMSLINGAFIAGNLPFYATNVFEVFGDANIFMRLRYMFYCCYWYPSLFIAANANHKVEQVKIWICKEENYSKIPETKLKVFLHEISYHTIGIASYGIITVTWNSVGSIISIILTYALLKSQMSQAHGPDENAQSNLTEIMSNFTM